MRRIGFVFSFAVISALLLWGSGIVPAIIPQSVPAANKQGNSTKFQLAGTNSGTLGNTLCNDASGNATDSGCTGGTGNPPAQGSFTTSGSPPSFTVTAGTHKFLTSALTVTLYDTASPRAEIFPNSLTVDPVSYAITWTTTYPMSGNYVINGGVGQQGPVGPAGPVAYYCAPSSASGVHYTCAPSPAATGYTAGMTVQFVPDVNGVGGAMDLALNGLAGGAKSIVMSDGTTNPTSVDLVAGTAYPLVYDGTRFRLPAYPAWRSCELIIGDPGTSSSVLASDNGSPAACGNGSGHDELITAVALYVNAGASTARPILTGGGSTSIVTGAITGSAGTWVAGSVNGSPILHSYGTDGATCSSTPCTLDGNIASADGTTKYMIIRFRIRRVM